MLDEGGRQLRAHFRRDPRLDLGGLDDVHAHHELDQVHPLGAVDRAVTLSNDERCKILADIAVGGAIERLHARRPIAHTRTTSMRRRDLRPGRRPS